MNAFARLLPIPSITATIRIAPEDFRVDELLGFDPEGQGEHCFIKIEKRGTNSDWVAKQLATFAGVKPLSVSYSGKKDRWAVTTQWFSVHLPGQEDPDWSALNSEQLKILTVTRHSKKLRRGVHKANSFVITLRDLSHLDFESLQRRFLWLGKQGIANYFGEQRFGHGFRNIDSARQLFAKQLRKLSRDKRSLYLSAARSWLFNLVLSQRIEQGRWYQLKSGDVVSLQGSNSIFVVDDASLADSIQRLALGDIHLTGPLWGKGTGRLGDQQVAWEKLAVQQDWDLALGLEANGLKMERRPLRVFFTDSGISSPEEGVVKLEFTLPSGCFATSLLRELVDYTASL